jgi:hypothetical protein
VRLVIDGPLLAGVTTLDWDGTLDDGTRAAPGVYLVRLRAAGATRTAKVVLTR